MILVEIVWDESPDVRWTYRASQDTSVGDRVVAPVNGPFGYQEKPSTVVGLGSQYAGSVLTLVGHRDQNSTPIRFKAAEPELPPRIVRTETFRDDGILDVVCEWTIKSDPEQDKQLARLLFGPR
jgi:hypothetical protein